MPGFVTNLIQLWQRAGLMQRVTLLGVLVGCLVAVVLLVGWAGKPEMAMLYRGLEPEDAARVVERLADEGVAYELREGGTAVFAPRNDIYALRLKMAANGLPQGGAAGYQLLDNQDLGASPFIQRKNYLRALEGELARTIRLLEAVESARVHVVQPESTLFASGNRRSTASVIVSLKPGRHLSGGNIAAIVNLIAGSVEGLATEDVAVVDAQGNLLSRQGSDAVAAHAGTLHEYRLRIEQDLARKAEEMLALALGPGRAVVRVSADVESTRTARVQTIYDPTRRVVTRETTTSRNETTPAAPQQGTGGRSGEESIDTHYEVSRTVEETLDLPGRVREISVAAFVDLTPPEAQEGEAATGAPADQPLLTVEQVRGIISRAIGLADESRIEVVATRFPASAVAGMVGTGEPQVDGPFGLGPYLEILRSASLGILVVGVLVAMWIFRGKGARGSVSVSSEQLAQLSAQGKAGALEGGREGRLLTAGGYASGPESQVVAALTENPEQVKKLFKAWLDNETGGA